MKNKSIVIGLSVVLLGTFVYAAPPGSKALKSAVSKVTPKRQKNPSYYNGKIKESFKNANRARFDKKVQKFKKKGGNIDLLRGELHKLNPSRAKVYLPGSEKTNALPKGAGRKVLPTAKPAKTAKIAKVLGVDRDEVKGVVKENRVSFTDDRRGGQNK